MAEERAILGVSDHGGWAFFVTATGDGRLVDRRRVELVADALPKLPHHHDGKALPIHEAVKLVDRVRASAEEHAKRALAAVANDVPAEIVALAMRRCPELPATTAERISNYRASNVADWVMYRQALAAAAEERGWPVDWHDPKRACVAAREALGVGDFDAYFAAQRSSVGPPWGQDQKLALAAALASARARGL